MEELLLKYVDMFQENFPMFKFMGIADTEIEAIIKKCLEEGIPCETKTGEKVI